LSDGTTTSGTSEAPDNRDQDNPEDGGPADEALLVELRAAAGRLDPVPADAVMAARSALAYRTLDAELASLTADSAVDDDRLALVRSVATPTLLTFDGPGLTVEVEVLVDGRRRRLLGQLVPAGEGEVEVRHRGGRSRVAADEVGRFIADDLPPGPVSLRCRAVGGRWVETDWFLA
jgi:hypothetical protein